ncbi:MAG: DUF4149 domain-containing protein [Planctomycetes bacterium]|nr:DUF4149 domain-containing protein [Planctomycetota bacterium]
MNRAVRALYFTALGLWVGGMATLAFVVAPTLFNASLPRATAGTIFGSVLRNFGPIQLALGVVAALAVLVLMKGGELKARSGLLRLSALTLMLLLACNAQFYLGPAIEHERASIANFDTMPPGVPARARVDSLHRWSVCLGTVPLFTGLGLLACSAAMLKSPDGP